MAPAPIVIPYAPRRAFVPYHERQERFGKIVAHRRFGKTVGCINDTIRAAWINPRRDPAPRYGYVAPTFGQAKDVAWVYLKHYTRDVPGIRVSESDLFVELPSGARVRLYGADNYDRMRGLYFDGITVDEPADIDPQAWPLVIRPTLSDYRGWATFIGTPKGRDWFYYIDKLEDGSADPAFFRLVLKASETGVLAPDELESARRMLTPEQYAQEYECSFEAAIVGSYYGKLMAALEEGKRITGVPYDPAARVWTSWDLGIRDATAIWFAQLVGKEVHVIDYYEASGADLGHYVREIASRPYVYAGHILPHDAWASELGTGKTRVEVLESLKLGNIVKAPDHSIEDGINAVRVILPKCWFDATKCLRGIDALKLYRAEVNDEGHDPTGKPVLKARPVHDWTSHPADSFRYLAMGVQEETTPTPRRRQRGGGWMGA